MNNTKRETDLNWLRLIFAFTLPSRNKYSCMIFIIYYLIFSASNCARALSSLFAIVQYILYRVLHYSAVTVAFTNQIKLCTLLLMIADYPLHYVFIMVFLYLISFLTLS